ncbi:ArdC family protein [Bacteroides caccae]|uniref:ArdC family protein n=1 Tax=Bacteroides caccae TaxID=47678 RepID=UPI002907354F|nr:zincin-like metallopeptidase domain-containing protein [Bacteroides caccae]MDU3629269.1 zincin-like metallopeptidase domain-containing protein [Bacteroides caccae]MDU3671804.1 zincin-like metallopeptidase domain-containing protein [Bacteroides caccae]
MAYGTNSSGNAGQVAIDRFAEMMIARMEQMKASDWKKGWIGGTSGFAGLPQNVGDRNYSGSNSFFLQLQTAAQGYRLPVYLTFKQAHNLKAHVLKGEKAFPVVYWDVLVKDKNGHKVSSDEYKAMSKEEKKGMDVIPFFKAFPVYNIDQTNLAEVQPERVQKLMEKFKVPELRDKEGMYAHAALDRMIETQGWLCPIQANKREDGAYYSPTRDIVVLPMKEQFNIGNTPEEIYRGGMEFYSTMLHEMTHSTMTPERLNREMGGRFGDPKYAKEELVAELTAAMISHSMGFDSKVTDNSAAYLDSWIGVLKQEPKFIVSIMADVNKASDLILDQVDKQRLALNEQPYLTKNDPFAPLGEGEEVPFKNAAIVKTRNGDYAIRASYDGVELGLKKVSKDTAKTYFQLTDYKDKAAFLNMTAHKTFEPEIANLKRTQAVGAKLSI